jgi:glucosamine kinase
VSPREIVRTCAGITGSGRAETARRMRELLMTIVSGQVEIIGDVEIAFEDAFGNGPGVIVIAGTGSVAYGRNSKGESRRAGGWGSMISDEGSGFWIGVEAVRSVLQARDRGQVSPLLNELLEALGAKDWDDLIVRVNAAPPPDFAALFPVVESAAERGNHLANDVLVRAGRELAKLAETILCWFNKEGAIAVAIHGGVLESSLLVKNTFAQELAARHPHATLLARAIDPARGALERARRNFKSANA